MSWIKSEPILSKILTRNSDCQPAYGGLAEIRFADSHPRLRKSAFGGQARKNFQKSASGFSLKKVRISFRTYSQFVKFAFPASLGASPLTSADEFSSNFQTSQSFFARKANAKRQFILPKIDYKFNHIKI